MFVAGCAVAIYRDIEEDRTRSLQESSRDTITTILSVYGENSGAISLQYLKQDPSRLENEGPFDGKVAMIRIDGYGSVNEAIKVPDESTYDDHPRTRERTISTTVPMDMGNGVVIPANMEVTLYGE